MKKKIDPKLLGEVREKLEEFEATPPYDTRELETSMEVLASSIFRLAEDDDEPSSLAEAVEKLPIQRKAKRDLTEICDKIQEALEVADYDSGDDEDNEDVISDLKSDFFWILDKELKNLEKAE